MKQLFTTFLLIAYNFISTSYFEWIQLCLTFPDFCCTFVGSHNSIVDFNFPQDTTVLEYVTSLNMNSCFTQWAVFYTLRK